MISRRRVLETMAAALAAARPWGAAPGPAAEQATAPAAQSGPGLALYPHLFSPLKFRNLTVKNRVFRSNVAGRFDNYDGSGNQARINWEVKFARGGVGAVISSFVPVAMRGRIMPNYATIDRDATVPFWKRLVEQVHGESDCKYILQLSHGGRQRDVPGIEYAKGLSSTDNKDPLHGFECERMTADQIQDVVKAFGQGARRAREAGADGVELHGANGYLLQQFMSTNANRRTDGYGGDIAGRIRFPVEVATAVAEEIGADRVGFRVSPGSPLGDIEESDVAELYPALVEALAPLGLAYLHVVRLGDEALLRSIRDGWPTGLVLNRAGADIDRRAQDVRDGLADVVSVGALALANPDLVARITAGAAMNDPDRSTLYGGGERGYTDYPRLAA
jgi:N-ethylmaleimide reductase